MTKDREELEQKVNEMLEDIERKENKKIIKRTMKAIIGAAFYILKKWLFSSIYKSASAADEAPLDENTMKHTKALLTCLIVIPFSYIAIMYGGEKAGDIVFYVSLAAQISGLAWFVISFAALPQRHLGAAMVVTQVMFQAFLSGVFSMITMAAIKAPLALPVIIPIFWWLYKAAILYDSADLLKAGKDEQEILAAQATQRMEKMMRGGIETMREILDATKEKSTPKGDS